MNSVWKLPRTPIDRSSGVFARMFAPAAGVLLGCLLVNCLVGVAVLKVPGWRVDPVFGDVMRPGVFVSSKEGYCVAHIGGPGFRAPPPETVRSYPERILFVGNSFTAARQVFDSDTFEVRVQQALRSQGLGVVSVNAGIEAASAASCLYFAAPLTALYRPTRVVVQMGDGSLGPALLRPDTAGCWLEPAGTGWTARRRAGVAVSALRDRVRNVLASLPVAQWLWQRLKNMGADAQVPDAARSSSANNVSPVLVDWVLGKLRERYGSNVVILYTPDFDYFGGANTPTPTERRVSEACSRLGIAFVDTREPFSRAYAATRQPLVGFGNTQPGLGHWNSEGHAVVAAELIRLLEPR